MSHETTAVQARPFAPRYWMFGAGLALLTACSSPPSESNGSGGGTGEAGTAGLAKGGGPGAGASGTGAAGDAAGGGAAGQGPDSTRFRSRISLGGDFGCAIASSGTVACWGTPLGGADAITPPGGQFIALASGLDLSCGLTSSATVQCWGNLSGAAATPIPAGLVGTSIGVGVSEQCVITSGTGELACWGAPQAITGTAPTGTFAQVSLAKNYGCLLTVEGALTCWGSDAYGQSTPPAGRFVQVASAAYHSCALRDDGSAQCWGVGGAGMPTDGGAGATGNDGTESWGQSIAPAGKKFKRLAVGFLHSCGILESGDIECWGAGTSAGDCKTFATCGQAVSQPGPFVDLALGASNSCGMLESGKIKCWGSNSGGRSTPPADFQ